MKCPNCDMDLKMTERQGVEIDYCPQCRGVWLDHGELDKIVDRSLSSVGQDRFSGDNYEPRKKRSFWERLDFD